MSGYGMGGGAYGYDPSQQFQYATYSQYGAGAAAG
eukprot:CAMPEP_0173393224 /NCGR_PEP_ID=MMETSP1356-20130122/21987_1 /TAXON_ID=77927 ORGANISM="Hemiselmis virescens, Strain PCC157" /NCGR_SAMPLE_ID=MMETSP1356 /ASSEMBLY_ACC=CAM_ASM_000847 /LENGTH=34 /DNA_ID= /DNA_START= /DNA_END= /DNA_ORIENTATION=